MNNLVSVLIPSYKGVPYLKNCSLRSVLNQTYTNYEIIIVNDGISPETKNFVDRLNNSKIRYYEFHKYALGVEDSGWALSGAINRNRCLDLVKGDFIAPLDQDDIWGPNCLKDKIDFFNKYPNTDLVYGKAYNISYDKEVSVIGHPFTEETREMYRIGNGHNCIPHLSVVYRSDLKKYKYPEKGKIAADYTLWRSIINSGHTISFLDKMDSLRNGNNNTTEGLDKIYLKLFKKNFNYL